MVATRLIQTQDYTGGLNLRADAFQIGENQSPAMLNVDVDPVRGFHSRRAWEDWEAVPGAEFTSWSPRNAFTHVKADGNEVIFLAVDGDVLWRAQGGSWADANVTASADPHDADFVAWKDDVYIACGKSQVGQRWRGGSFTPLEDPATSVSGPWSDDPLLLESNTMPRAEFVAVHQGSMWVANTVEDGIAYPQRVRFSYPNKPDAWASLDYIDFAGADGPITGIVSYRDQLFVFFPKEVWVLYGYDAQSFSRERLAWVGASNRQCITLSETSLYFANTKGVFQVSPDSNVGRLGVDEVTVLLRPAFESNAFSKNADLYWLSWADQRLWWSVPYDVDGAPTVPRSMFVLDPSIGAWVLHELGDGDGVTNVLESVELDGPAAVSFGSPRLLSRASADSATDVVAGVEHDFESFYRTGWVDAGMPTIKKRFKRPDLVTARGDQNYEVTMFVYHDYDSGNAKRTKLVTVDGVGSEGLWYADPEWDGTDASLDTPPPGAPIWSATPDPAEAGWEASVEGSRVERAGSLGNCVAVQLELRGPLGQPWGVNSIIYKYVLRRIR